MRRLAAAFALAGAALGFAVLRRRREARERLELFFGDGSMITLVSTTSQAARLLPLARRILASARG